MFTESPNGIKRKIDWPELNQLKKDILWIFDENGGELQIAFVPPYSFTLPYWEYATISSDEHFGDKDLYREGALIILLGMLAEYTDIPAGCQTVFGATSFEEIVAGIRLFVPENENQRYLKEAALLGLSIAASITKEDISSNEECEHPHLPDFRSRLRWADKTFIQAYYKAKLSGGHHRP